MFNLADVFLILAFLSTLAVTILTQQPSGPEGPVGVWLVLLIPCLFLATLVIIMFGKEVFDFIPGGNPIRIVIAVGILITFSIAIFGSVDRQKYSWAVQGLVITVPYLILAACAVLNHKTDFPEARVIFPGAAVVIGIAALAGWGLAAQGTFLYVRNALEEANLKAQKEQEQEDQREQWEVTEYARLGDTPSLYALLQFVWARNERIRQQARERVNGFPELDARLTELLDQDSEEAISYIAKVYENPPATFTPAWGRMLQRQLKKWDSLQYDEHAGTWENNLINYIEGARKIQMAGGSLHGELQAWHVHLLKCKGLGNLAALVESLLKTNNKS